jgi:hypothetical protein
MNRRARAIIGTIEAIPEFGIWYFEHADELRAVADLLREVADKLDDAADMGHRRNGGAA